MLCSSSSSFCKTCVRDEFFINNYATIIRSLSSTKYDNPLTNHTIIILEVIYQTQETVFHQDFSDSLVISLNKGNHDHDGAWSSNLN